ncbi:unnamed protein product, partial [Angiostrongylus costaricensis]|uniref:SSD domain-containing protein n=1 Tax=Angiostrongylus costaricensis TaxID=334426 RepID=A0A0R3PZA2_ANGCS
REIIDYSCRNEVEFVLVEHSHSPYIKYLGCFTKLSGDSSDNWATKVIFQTILLAKVTIIYGFSLSTSSNVFPGYGMRTLCELSSYSDFDQAHHWDRCGNIMDYFACYLTGSDEISMSESNALAWGYSRELEWNSEIIPFTPKWMKLPKIVRSAVVRKLYTDHYATKYLLIVASFVYLNVSLRASRIMCLSSDLIIGTSSQLCFVVSDTLKLPTLPITTHVFPFSKGLTLVAAASMNGGNALDAILSVPSSQPKISPRNVPRVNSVFTAERGSAYTGSIDGMMLFVGFQMLVGVCEGVVRNLFGLVPPELFSSLGVERLYLVGNAKRQRFAVHIQKCLDELCHKFLIYGTVLLRCPIPLFLVAARE